MGRFISEDPAADPNNPNLYVYAANNPLVYIDPTGLLKLRDIGLANPGGVNYDPDIEVGGGSGGGSGGDSPTSPGSSSSGSTTTPSGKPSNNQDNLGQPSNTGVPPNPEPELPKDGPTSITLHKADKIIKDNTKYIKDAEAEFGVNPAILAACIYTEQRLNVDWKDFLTDRPLYFLDTSVGISQVRISTAQMMEDAGYMPKTQSYKIYANRIVISPEEAIADKLMDNQTNVRYAAAYLAYWQDKWKDSYPEIAERTAILATLYNLGTHANEPNSNPESIPFGDFAEENYNHMRSLLGLD